MNLDELFSEAPMDEDMFHREERCRRTLKTLGKALFMRVFLIVLMGFVMLRAKMGIAPVTVLLLVAILNVGSMVPLIREWKARKRELNQILRALDE